MKSIAEISEEIYPLDFDLELAKEKGIGDKETYEKIQKNYLIYLSAYLNSLYDFSKVDKELNSKGFKPTTEASYYLDRSELGSKYIYLRNNIHCEYLSKEQIQFFLDSSGDALDEEGREIILETYDKVLSAYSKNLPDSFLLSYTGGSNLKSMVKNSALLFYINFENTKIGSETYFEDGRKEKEVIETLSKEIKGQLNQGIPDDIEIFYSGWYVLD